ncbi:MAG: hypothetical protein JKY37_11580 [Nannocystaceae bacterium]|nr:hypothetical protein [Nannocystaceae bacterium]
MENHTPSLSSSSLQTTADHGATTGIEPLTSADNKPAQVALAAVESGAVTSTMARGVTARLDVDAAALGLTPDRVAHAAELIGVFAPVVRGVTPAHRLGLYDALRNARIAGRTEVVARRLRDDAPLAQILDFRPVSGTSDIVCQRLDVAMARTADAIAKANGEDLSPDYLAAEVGHHLKAFFERIYASRWFQAVYDKTITRGQYVYTLSNMHQFVRFTTRILGRCVATADDPNLRVHFIRHLQGEVNHELIIERDLTAMGEDVAYVRDRMAPNLATRQFMAAQESAIAFHRDPILLMAAPLAAEGISGHLDNAFLDALHESAAGWGVSDPSRVTRFYSSHMDLDGGEDGHWEDTVRMLAAHLTDETKLARFLSVLAATTAAMEGCYDSWIDDIRLG